MSAYKISLIRSYPIEIVYCIMYHSCMYCSVMTLYVVNCIMHYALFCRWCASTAKGCKGEHTHATNSQ